MFQENFDEQLANADKFWNAQVKNRRNFPRAKRDILNSYEKLLNILKTDGSRGIHNSGYTDKIFEHLNALEQDFNSAPDKDN
jgi:hypothetical protein